MVVPFRYDEIGERLKAFRLGSKLSADEIAKRIGISRTALYHLERGELVKLETLEKLADLLSVSIPTLLGVGTEYIPSAVTYFERLRQIELRANHIVVLAGSFSFLLSSDRFHKTLEQVLRESIDEDAVPNRGSALADINQIIQILDERKRNYKLRKPHIVNLISGSDIERFLRFGLRDHARTSEEVWHERRQVAREETQRLASLIEEEEMGIQLAVFTLPLPRFHIFRQPDQTVLTTSPFRLVEQPNIGVGVAMITSAPEALSLHERQVAEMWRKALKGAAAAKYLRDLIAQVDREMKNHPVVRTSRRRSKHP
jgi:transcriptional regulator with XRE-family HTH domain